MKDQMALVRFNHQIFALAEKIAGIMSLGVVMVFIMNLEIDFPMTQMEIITPIQE